MYCLNLFPLLLVQFILKLISIGFQYRDFAFLVFGLIFKSFKIKFAKKFGRLLVIMEFVIHFFQLLNVIFVCLNNTQCFIIVFSFLFCFKYPFHSNNFLWILIEKNLLIKIFWSLWIFLTQPAKHFFLGFPCNILAIHIMNMQQSGSKLFYRDWESSSFIVRVPKFAEYENQKFLDS